MNADPLPQMLDAAAAVLVARGLGAVERGPAALEEARARAALTLAAADGRPLPDALVLAPFAGALLVELLAASEDDGAGLDGLASELERAGVPALALLRESLRAPAILTLDPARACRTALQALRVCGQLSRASLWSRDASGRLVCHGHVGTGSPSAATRRLARRTLAEEADLDGSAGEMVTAAISRGGRPVAALVGRSRRGARARASAFVAEACAPLAAILEREALLAAGAASERMLLQAAERRLTRLGYDLHDGPLQELLLVGEELALFRRQLAVVLDGRRGNELLGGRLDDLDARLLALERGLRGISSSVHSDVLVTQPFRESLRDLLEPFAARTGIEPTLACRGQLDAISTSQRLAVLSVVGEALNNVREHGGASAVHIEIALDRDGLRASVRDDGRGFDVEEELLRAARSGHMGLAGMHERVRLLDGHCRVESRPGGPTEVAVSLPRWDGHAPQRAARGDGSRAHG